MFNTEFSLYGTMIIIGIILNMLVIIYLANKYKFCNDHILYLIIYEVFGIITGAKIFTFITQYDNYNGQFNFVRVGMSSYGAVIGGIITLIIFSIQFKKKLSDVISIFIPSVPLMYGIGKIGCFLAGCCRGIDYSGIGAITYKYGSEYSNISYFPVQIIESICFIIIFVYLFSLHKKNKFNDKSIGISFILCGIFKFGLDFLRLSHVNLFLSINQFVSLFFIMIGLYIVIKNKETILSNYIIRKKKI